MDDSYETETCSKARYIVFSAEMKLGDSVHNWKIYFDFFGSLLSLRRKTSSQCLYTNDKFAIAVSLKKHNSSKNCPNFSFFQRKITFLHEMQYIHQSFTIRCI